MDVSIYARHESMKMYRWILFESLHLVPQSIMPLSKFVANFPRFKVFDNVDIDDVAKIALGWEQRVGLIKGGDIAAREKRWARGDSLTLLSAKKVGDLATELCERARENSLDNTKDSPFAMLAKDNDIMWSGGKYYFIIEN